jgi:transcriptional antiterminator
MLNITARLRQILILMLEEEQYISVKVLAEKLNISKRTLQRELKYIEQVLENFSLTYLSKTGVGILIQGTKEERERLLHDLKQDSGYDVSNKGDRRKRLILEILKEKGLQKLFYYSSLLEVSEATVSNDLEAIEDWLLAHGLRIIRKPGSGIEIEGNEESYRKAIRIFIEENIDTKLIQSLYDNERLVQDDFFALQQSHIGTILNDEILKRVVECIRKMNDKRILSLTEKSYVGLVLHISIAINRIQKKEILKEGQTWVGQMKQDEEYRLASKIVTALENEFKISIPVIETAYICLHIKGSKHQNIEWNHQKTYTLKNKEMLSLVNELVNAFDPQIAFELKQDDDFIQGLLAHLQPTIVRLIYQMNIQNPVLAEVKSEYKEVFEKSRRAAKVLERWTNQKVPEAEIGFLAIHFEAAIFRLEGRKESIRIVSVGIVCASGIGISRLISLKLEKAFRGRISIETYGRNDLTPYIKAKTDFFVDSILVEDEDAHMIHVSPLLSQEDMGQINNAIYHYERTPQKENTASKFTIQMEQVNHLTSIIKKIIAQLKVFRVVPDIAFEALVGYIAEQFSPYQLSQEQICSDILNREKIGTQVFAEFSFALLHVRTTGVLCPSFSVCLTTTHEAFLDPYWKEIQVVIIMLIPDDEFREINSQLLGHLSSTLIADYTFFETLKKGEKEKIQALVAQYLNQFFCDYLNKLE